GRSGGVRHAVIVTRPEPDPGRSGAGDDPSGWPAQHTARTMSATSAGWVCTVVFAARARRGAYRPPTPSLSWMRDPIGSRTCWAGRMCPGSLPVLRGQEPPGVGEWIHHDDITSAGRQRVHDRSAAGGD